MNVRENRTEGHRPSQPGLNTDTTASTPTSMTTTQITTASVSIEMKDQGSQVHEQPNESQGNQEITNQTQKQDPTQDRQEGEQQCNHQDTTPTIMSVGRVGDKQGTQELEPTLFTEGDYYQALQELQTPGSRKTDFTAKLKEPARKFNLAGHNRIMATIVTSDKKENIPVTLDSGARISVYNLRRFMELDCSKHLPIISLPTSSALLCHLADRTEIKIDKYVWMPLLIKGEILPAKVYLYDQPVEATQSLLLGLGWLQSHNINLTFQEDTQAEENSLDKKEDAPEKSQ